MGFFNSLLDLGKKHSIDNQGLAYGITLQWIEACLMNEEKAFNDQIIHIQRHTPSISNPPDLKYLRVYQKPGFLRKLFSSDPQNSKIESSKKVEDRGGLQIVASKLRIFTQQELTDYLIEISNVIDAIEPQVRGPVALLLSNHDYALGLSYEVDKGWKYLNIDEPPPISASSLEAYKISAAIFSRYPMVNMVGMAQIITLGDNPEIPQLKEKFNNLFQQYPITIDQAKRTGNASLLWLAAGTGQIDQVKELLQNGAKANYKDFGGRTPFWMACQDGYLEVAKLLVQKGAKPNIKSHSGCSPLLIASQNGHTNLVRFLIENNAKVNEGDKKGLTPLDLACRNGHLETVKLLLAHGAKVNVSDKNGSSPLWKACANGHFEIARLLIAHGAKIEKRGAENSTPLHLACQNGHLDLVRLLLANGAKIDTVAKNHHGPISSACQNGHLEIVQTLVAHGAIIDAYYPDESLVEIARRNNHLKIVDFLQNKNAKKEAPPREEMKPETSKTATNRHAFFTANSSQDPKKAIAALHNYAEKRKTKWQFYYNVLGIISLIYTVHNWFTNSNLIESKSRDTKISGAIKVRNLLKGEQNIILSPTEIEACKQGNLGKILNKHQINIDELQRQQSQQLSM